MDGREQRLYEPRRNQLPDMAIEVMGEAGQFTGQLAGLGLVARWTKDEVSQVPEIGQLPKQVELDCHSSAATLRRLGKCPALPRLVKMDHRPVVHGHKGSLGRRVAIDAMAGEHGAGLRIGLTPLLRRQWRGALLLPSRFLPPGLSRLAIDQMAISLFKGAVARPQAGLKAILRPRLAADRA